MGDTNLASIGWGLSRLRIGTVVAFVVLVVVGRQISPTESRAATISTGENPKPNVSELLSVETYISDSKIRHRIRDRLGNVVATELTPAQLDLRYPELRTPPASGLSPFGVTPAALNPR
jgi:hypothetical protein